jgi:hypothetical protein
MMNCLEEFCSEKHLSESTEALYLASVKVYEALNNKSLDELIEEADAEEEEGIRWKRRTLKTRLIAFRKFLFENKSQGTANRYLGCIKTIYRHFEIELQELPSFNSRQVEQTYIKTYEDIPTKAELIDAYYEANNVCKCIILFASSSGMSKVDFLKLTVDSFIEACSDYITSDELITQLKELKEQNEVIPCFEGCRQKTGTRYTTFCSPEAVEHIVQYLLGRNAQIIENYEGADEEEQEDLPDQLYRSDKLFDISNSHLLYTFRKINNKLKLGKVGYSTKFRCHQLRAFQASTLVNLEDNPFTIDEVDALQGRKKDRTHRAYFTESKSKLFKKYYDNVDSLMFFKSIHGVDEETFEKVIAENSFYKKEIVKNEQKLEAQERTINQIISNQKELEALLGL